MDTILCAAGLGDGEYMAFGFARNKIHSQMLRSDAVVCIRDINTTVTVHDYYLQYKRPCTRKRNKYMGVCPDTAFGGSSQLRKEAGGVDGNITFCTFTRNKIAKERKFDKSFSRKRNNTIVWAIGPVGANGVIYRHSRHSIGHQTLDVLHGDLCHWEDLRSCCQNHIASSTINLPDDHDHHNDDDDDDHDDNDDDDHDDDDDDDDDHDDHDDDHDDHDDNHHGDD